MRLAIVPDEEAEEADYGAPTCSSTRGSRATSRSRASRPTCTSGSPRRACSPYGSKSAAGPPTVRPPGRATTRSSRRFAVFRTIESLPFSRESSELFDRPSINLGRIWGGDALEQGSRQLRDRRGHPLPTRTGRGRSARRDRRARGLHGRLDLHPPTGRRRPLLAVSCGRSCAAAKPHHEGEVTGVGRDGASDAISFLRAGIPAVEFGPLGAGHHGPEEWVSVSSLGAYRRALGDFARSLPAALALEEAR